MRGQGRLYPARCQEITVVVPIFEPQIAQIGFENLCNLWLLKSMHFRGFVQNFALFGKELLEVP